MKNSIKIGLVLLLLTCQIGLSQENTQDKVKYMYASYQSHDTEGFYFTNDKDKSTVLFVKIAPPVLNKYDLMGVDFVGQSFRITYQTKKVGDEEQRSIINMEKNYDDEYDDEN